MKVYLAGPIFTYGDLLRNTEWAGKIRQAFPGIDLYSPVENTDINGVEGKKKFAGSKEVAAADNARLNNTDILIACIDGDVLPAGTCAEIGKFHEKIARGDKKFIIGICTDNRQCFYTHSAEKDKGGAASLGEQQYSYQNIYVTGLIKQYGVLVYTIEEVIHWMHKWQESRSKAFFDGEEFCVLDPEEIRNLKNGYYDDNPVEKQVLLNKSLYNNAKGFNKKTISSVNGTTDPLLNEEYHKAFSKIMNSMKSWTTDDEDEIGGDHIND